MENSNSDSENSESEGDNEHATLGDEERHIGVKRRVLRAGPTTKDNSVKLWNFDRNEISQM